VASPSPEAEDDPVPSPLPPPLVEVIRLEKWFGPQPAVRGVDFALRQGEFLVLFGPNGAGKTTLLRLLAGSLRPTRGEIRIPDLNGDAEERATAWRRRIGVLSHQTYLYSHLTARENLTFYGKLYGLKALGERVEELLVAVGLQDRAEQRVRGFSRGMQQRLALARTLLHEPGLVLLDEPYTGLDPHAALMLRGLLEHLRDGNRTIVMVTHNLTQGLELASRVVIQADGRWLMDQPRSTVDASTFEHLYTERLGELP
jgi:heme exporter protein A